eukprot:4102586-Pyramimonas_sp.AAC.1
MSEAIFGYLEQSWGQCCSIGRPPEAILGALTDHETSQTTSGRGGGQYPSPKGRGSWKMQEL